MFLFQRRRAAQEFATCRGTWIKQFQIVCCGDDDIVVIHRHLDAVEPPLRWSWPYLLFLKAYDGILYPTHTPLLIESGKLVYPWRNEVPNQHVNPLEGHTLTEVAKQVRQIRGSR